MIIQLEEKRNNIDVFFWLLDLAKNQWANASVYISDETGVPEMVTKGLTPQMYACLFSLDDLERMCLKCTNEDTIVYERSRPTEIRAEGMDSFVNRVPWSIPEYESKDQWTVIGTLQFGEDDAFNEMAVEDQLLCLFRAAELAHGKFELSSKETSGRLISVVSKFALSGYDSVADVLISIKESGWILWNKMTSTIYTCGLSRDERGNILKGIIATD